MIPVSYTHLDVYKRQEIGPRMVKEELLNSIYRQIEIAGRTCYKSEGERRDGGCLWYDLKKQRRPPLPAVYPKNQAAAERIFAFVEVLKDVMKRKGYQERRKPIAK